MQVTEAGTTLVLSDTTPEEKKRILSAIKQPERAQPETLTRKQAAKIFGVHPGSLKRWEKSGKLRPIKITARTLRYDKREIEAMLQGVN
jgi:transposase-like protein